VYYNYTLSNNGVAEKHDNDYHADYLTDLVRNRSVAFINARLTSPQGGSPVTQPQQPVFVVASVPSAHEPADPAPQHAGFFFCAFFCCRCLLLCCYSHHVM
jgi:hypothetical protein